MPLHKFSLFSFLLVLCSSCGPDEPMTEAKAAKSLTAYVNTFIGTGGHGHTYPGATMPFGMMQLSPDTRLEGWDGSSGYHYSDDTIYGFSHTHLSGTGVSDYGDIHLMPTNAAILNNGADGKPGYKSRFSHDNESASPGYYSVYLEDTDIEVELTVSKRSGIHKYQYPTEKDQFVILDLEHRDKLLEHEINLESATVISGKRFSSAWANRQMLFYYIETSHLMKNWDKTADSTISIKALQFINPTNQPIIIKIGISAVDIAGAKANLEAEIGHKTFHQIRQEADSTWEKELSKIVVEDDDLDKVITFYSALYHTMLAPNLYQDVDGRYRGMDLEVNQTNNFEYYTVFSLWDTYRAAHPLYTIIDQKRTNDFINTFIAKYDEGGILPIWDLSGNYTGCMIGYHAVPVIADAYRKGITGYDVSKAFEAMKHSAKQDKLGLAAYKKNGFIPVEEESESVSKTLEYAYDDWTIAMMARELGKMDDYNTFIKRAQNYKNVFNPETKFFQGRSHNAWFEPFDPYEVNFNYTEANAWQYSLYAPHDITGHMKLMGGKEQYEKHLDNLFNAPTRTSGRDQADITGLIGQYAHGNEPSHHMAYLYDYVGKPHKTQQRVHEIMTTLYKNSPDGISGNEDCGQMSAWYVLSSLGFYPVTPASNQYAIGSPLFKKATIHFENGKSLTITRDGDGPYIHGMDIDRDRNSFINNRPYNATYVTHKELMAGGHWSFEMSTTPSKWGSAIQNRPKSSIADEQIISPPFISKGSIAFPKTTEVSLSAITPKAIIFYVLAGRKVKRYTSPFTIDHSTTLSTYAVFKGERSATIKTAFYKYDSDRSITLDYSYANQYSAGGDNALINGITGSKDYRSGAWQGIKDEDLHATVDLGSSKPIREVEVNFLKDQRSWIFYPRIVTIQLLDKNETVVASSKVKLPETGKEEISDIHTVKASFNIPNAQYVRITATNYGALPDWHLGYPDEGTAWIFVDEISIE